MKDYKLTQEEFDGVIHYYASFVDEGGVEQTTEIALEVFEVIDASQRKISSQARRDRRYGLCSFDDSIADFGINYKDFIIEKKNSIEYRPYSIYWFKLNDNLQNKSNVLVYASIPHEITIERENTQDGSMS